MTIKGAVRLIFGLLTNDREGGVKGEAAQAAAQNWTRIQAAYKKCISRDKDCERGEGG